jgi:hypothetical protein
MARWRLPLLLAALVGLPMIWVWCAYYDRASPPTPRSQFGHLVLCAALVVNVLGLVVALIALWRKLRRPMLWFGSVGCIALLSLVIVGLLNPNERVRYDPESLKVIKPGMAIEEVEEILGISLAGTINNRENPDQSFLIITTRHHTLPPFGQRKEWAVAEETFLIRFDENGRVVSTVKGGHTFRDERFLERTGRRLSTTLGL